MMKKRIEYIDLAKGICIFLVVLNHETYYYNISFPLQDVLNQFRLPLYFILSGLFFKKYSGFADFAVRKTNKLLIPFASFFLLTCIIQDMLLGHLGVKTLFQELFVYERLHYNYAIWFLPCLFEVNIFFYMINNFVRSKYQYLFAIFIGVFGILLQSIDLPFYTDKAIVFLPFFMFGFFLKNQTNFLSNEPYWKKDILFVSLFLTISLLFPLLFFSQSAFLHVFIQTLQFYVCGIAGTMIILFVARLLRKVQPFSFWGRYSVVILCTHFVFVIHIKHIFDRMQIVGLNGMILNIVLTMLLCSFCVPSFVKYLPYMVAQKDLFTWKKRDDIVTVEVNSVAESH